ncbi:MAG: cytochrome P450 [Chloroflexota bacterium]
MPKSLDQIPGPAPIGRNPFKLITFLQELNRNALGILDNAAREYGEIMAFTVLGHKQVMVSNPDALREVLVTKAKSFHKDADYTDKNIGIARFAGNGILVTDGEFWKKHRKLVQPALHTSRIREYADTMSRYTVDMVEDWQTKRDIDLAEEMMHLTLRIVARTLFDTDIRDNADDITDAMEALNEGSSYMRILPAWVPTPTELAVRRSLVDLDAYVFDLIKKRRAEGTDHGDLLSMLLLTETEDGERMSDQQVRDEAVTLFLAGHETTANALNWTFWLLAQNPEAEAKLHTELDTVLNGRPLTLADLPNLPYTDWVIKESMRYMPPVSGVGRVAIEDVQIGDYLLPAGTKVVCNIFSVQRNERYWDEPLTFRPERFAPENEADRNRYTYLPFGAGPRVCIGVNFANMEAQLLLATIAQNYTLRLKPDHEVIPVARITTYPKDGLPMSIQVRETKPTPEFA